MITSNQLNFILNALVSIIKVIIDLIQNVKEVK